MLSQSFINNAEVFCEELNDKGWVSIPNLFTEQKAEELLSIIKQSQNWELATLRQGRPFVVSINELKSLQPQVRAQFLNEVIQTANSEKFQYLYEFIRLIGADSFEQPAFESYIQFLQSKEALQQFSKVVGKEVTEIDAQVTKFAAGCFLKTHCDVRADDTKERVAAYVIGLTEEWSADWGGLLNILDDDGDVIKTFVPQFNNVNIFKVPKEHFVSQVANYCNKPRYSITGWLWGKKK